ncbi:beta-propeller domain-containing protein [Candidatus Formimonas warabiya]|uniref:beta-propeller domain-containing protein n=1 Tax=Formimonas warabiya TaxID=1761012 RepID=UPI0011D048DD|nr:beta-propeller domain-containing protein [Candidatus Formimonas warabiya]
MKKLWLFVGLLFALVCLTVLAFKPVSAKSEGEIKDCLPTVGSYENLKKLLAAAQSSRSQILRNGAMGVTGSAQFAEKAVSAPLESPGGTGEDYSSTNIQVQGVDEADIVKTDGKYIYQVNQGRVIVLLAQPPEKMVLSDTIKFEDGKFSPQELYVDDKYLVVIGAASENAYVDEQKIAPGIRIYPPVWGRGTVKAVIFDISKKDQIKQVREVELAGNYLSSRKIGDELYLVANKYLDQPLRPSYRDSARTDSLVEIPYQEIRYFPECVEPNYLLVAGLNLAQPDREMKVSAYLGAGENIYATEKDLYVAVTGYETKATKPAPEMETMVYKFTLENGQVTYAAKGEVPGTILNQFSMDDHQGYFRIATTKGEIWRTDENTSKNNIYILNADLHITGKIEDIAPGEKIYSVRFMGDRAYLVTFKTVDPLFVVDLHNPEKPQILGALKIPGYSDYLHPYDENHIIGFGKDTTELSQKDWEGKEFGTMAFYQGIKIALFDVTAVAHPVQMYQEVIGDRGTDSELLHNHKALLFSRERNLMAFPVTVMKISNKESLPDNVIQYGEFSFQGAYVYQIDLKEGFKLKGTITHLDPDDNLKAGYDWYASNKNIERILYIGDTLYTLSKSMIKAHDLRELKEISHLNIPQ